jgi:arylsulfatase
VIDGIDMREFLLGDADESGRDTVLCLQGNRLQAIKWRQWKIHLFQQDAFLSTWEAYNIPLLFNLEWDQREEHEVGFPHAWVAHPMAAAAGAFLRTLAAEPPIKAGTPDPFTPPKPGDFRPEEVLQIGPITQYVTTMVRANGAGAPPEHAHGFHHAAG